MQRKICFNSDCFYNWYIYRFNLFIYLFFNLQYKTEGKINLCDMGLSQIKMFVFIIVQFRLYTLLYIKIISFK